MSVSRHASDASVDFCIIGQQSSLRQIFSSCLSVCLSVSVVFLFTYLCRTVSLSFCSYFILPVHHPDYLSSCPVCLSSCPVCLSSCPVCMSNVLFVRHHVLFVLVSCLSVLLSSLCVLLSSLSVILSSLCVILFCFSSCPSVTMPVVCLPVGLFCHSVKLSVCLSVCFAILSNYLSA